MQGSEKGQGNGNLIMEYEYFYGKEPEQYAFYKIPKILIVDEVFGELPTEAKFLYGILLDRLSLSIKNNWVDKAGRNYIYMTIENVMQEVGCARQKACKLLKVLEDEGIIERVRQGFGRPNFIYVKNILKPTENLSTYQMKTIPKKDDNQTYVSMNKIVREVSESNTNNTNINNTYINNTNISRTNVDKYKLTYEDYFKKSLDLENLREELADDVNLIDAVFGVLISTIAANEPEIRIEGQNISRGIVIVRLMKLNRKHMEYVVSYLKENEDLSDNREFIISCLYKCVNT